MVGVLARPHFIEKLLNLKRPLKPKQTNTSVKDYGITQKEPALIVNAEGEI